MRIAVGCLGAVVAAVYLFTGGLFLDVKPIAIRVVDAENHPLAGAVVHADWVSCMFVCLHGDCETRRVWAAERVTDARGVASFVPPRLMRHGFEVMRKPRPHVNAYKAGYLMAISLDDNDSVMTRPPASSDEVSRFGEYLCSNITSGEFSWGFVPGPLLIAELRKGVLAMSPADRQQLFQNCDTLHRLLHVD